MMAKLKCVRCKFKWKPKTEDIPPVCPYCGKEGCVVADGDPEMMELEQFFR